MLTIHINSQEYFNEATSEFLYYPSATIHLEYSLNAIALWESKWNRPFLSNGPKTVEEFVDFVKCMTLEDDVDDSVYLGISTSQIQEIEQYMSQKATAATFKETGGRTPNNGSYVSAETIYYQMIMLNIPPEYAYWHLGRLLALIRFCANKNSPKKKMSNFEVAQQYRQLNEARKKALHTKG